MFLRNYDNFLLAVMGADAHGDTSSASHGYVNSSGDLCYGPSVSFGTNSNRGDGYINFRTMANEIVEATMSITGQNNYSFIHCPTAITRENIVLGTGVDEVTYEDYKLSGNSISTDPLVFYSQNLTWNDVTKKFTRSVTFTYTNATDSDVTIREWGLAVRSKKILVFREVLPEPITIAAGTTGTLTFSIELPMFNHP